MESETDPSVWAQNWDGSALRLFTRRPRTDLAKAACVTTAIDIFIYDDDNAFIRHAPNSVRYGPSGQTYEAVMKVFRSLGDGVDVWEQWKGSRDVVRFMDAWGWVLRSRNSSGP